MIFLATIKQVGIFLFYIAIGFALCKSKIIDKKASKSLSVLLTYLIAPLYTISNLSKNVTIDKISIYANLLLFGTIVSVVLVLIARPLAKLFAKNKLEKSLFSYLFAFSNLGYFGNPLVQAVFGDAVLTNYILFCVPASILISSYGYYILTKGGEETDENLTKEERKKVLLKRVASAFYAPPIIGVYIGLILAFLPITLPSVFYDLLQPAVNCYTAIPMLVAGIVLAGCPFKKLFTSWKAYVMGFIRLLGMPIIFGGLAYLLYAFCGLEKAVVVAIFCCVSLPCGMNVVVYPESVGHDSTVGARVCFISYLMAIITVPIVFMVLENLVGGV